MPLNGVASKSQLQSLFVLKETQSAHSLLVRNAETSLFSHKQGGRRSILLLPPLDVSVVNGNYRQMVLKRETITKEKDSWRKEEEKQRKAHPYMQRMMTVAQSLLMVHVPQCTAKCLALQIQRYLLCLHKAQMVCRSWWNPKGSIVLPAILCMLFARMPRYRLKTNNLHPTPN